MELVINITIGTELNDDDDNNNNNNFINTIDK